MPSRSKAQFRLMAAAASNPKFAAKAGIPPKVAKEFHAADRGANYKKLPEQKSVSGRTAKTVNRRDK